MRLLAWFACSAALLTGCAKSDDPTLHVSADDPDHIRISIARAPDHSFGRVTATINGADAGQPTLAAGHDPGWNTSPFADQAYPATATFVLTSAQIGTSLHFAVDDDGSRYVLDVPDFGSPRTPTIVTPLDQPLHPNDWVEVVTGVDTDRIGDGMLGKVNDQICFTQWSTEVGTGSTKFELPPDFTTTWTCNPTPTAGTPLAIQLEVGLQVWPKITTCSGTALTCDPIDLFLPDTTVTATIEP